MLDEFLDIYHVFNDLEVSEPFLETLRLIDLLSYRAISEINLNVLDQNNLDFATLARKRKEGIPFEYILGKAPFLGNMFYCSPATLIPRQETELLAKSTLELIRQLHKEKEELFLIDMGTGCGNIAVSLALNSKHTTIFASDLAPDTISIAQKNVDQYNLQNRISLYSGDLFTPLKPLNLEGKIDIIVCNPPYIPTTLLEKLGPEIINNEPRTAFDAGPFGLDFYRRLINDSPVFLKPNGYLIFEIGAGQDKLVTRLLAKKKIYEDIKYFDDGTEIRVICATCHQTE